MKCDSGADDEYEAGDILKAMVIVATVYLLLGLLTEDCGEGSVSQTVVAATVTTLM